MKFIGWTNAKYENKDWPSCDGYLDPMDEKHKLWNPDKKIFISADDISEYTTNFQVSREEASKILKEENDKKPNWIDEDKANYWDTIDNLIYEATLNYCVDNHVFFTDWEHQSEDFKGVPVLEDENGKYVLLMTLRAWGGFMADVWNKILKTNKFGYIDFYCGGCPKEVEDYLVNLPGYSQGMKPS